MFSGHVRLCDRFVVLRALPRWRVLERDRIHIVLVLHGRLLLRLRFVDRVFFVPCRSFVSVVWRERLFRLRFRNVFFNARQPIVHCVSVRTVF